MGMRASFSGPRPRRFAAHGRVSPATVLALFLCVGCSCGTDENLGMGSKPQPAAVDVAKLTQPTELLRVLALPGSELDRRLGARHVEASSSVKLEPPGKPAETLDETFKLDNNK